MVPNPKVSIIIPVYNGSNYLKEAVDSALSQTYKNVEILVINDGSNDRGKTEKICESYGNKIRYFKKENGGVASALNLGIEEMKGEYFSWLSHDDVYYPEKIEKQIKFLSKLKEKKKVVLFANFELMDKDSQFIRQDILNHEELSLKPEYALLRGCINGITLLIPKTAFEKHGNFDVNLRCTQDYDLWMKFMQSYNFIHMETVFTKTRIHSAQDTVSNPKVISEGNKLWISMMESVSEKRKKELEGSVYNFYENMANHLSKSIYKKAEKYALNKANEIFKEKLDLLSEKEKLISVIIPCYNQGKYVNEAVSSILSQTYQHFEIIIINDGSTDSYTNRLLKNYSKPKTRVYSIENSGPASTRNYGFLKTKGSFIQFLDADDFLIKDKFEKQNEMFTNG